MSGYYGYSMSNNAVAAYERGEKPLSKWHKCEILEELKSQDLPDDVMGILHSLSLSVLKSHVLVKTSWHHTSSRYNRTDFYSVKDLSCISLDEIKKWNNKRKENETKTTYKARAEWIEWEGNYRRYKKPVRYAGVGEISGKWFFPDDGGKKKLITGNGFRVIEVLR